MIRITATGQGVRITKNKLTFEFSPDHIKEILTKTKNIKPIYDFLKEFIQNSLGSKLDKLDCDYLYIFVSQTF